VDWFKSLTRYIAIFLLVFGAVLIISTLINADYEEYYENSRKKDPKDPSRSEKFLAEVKSITKFNPETRLERALDNALGNRLSSSSSVVELPEQQDCKDNPETPESHERPAKLVVAQDPRRKQQHEFADSLLTCVQGGTLVEAGKGPDPRASKHWRQLVKGQTTEEQHLTRLGVSTFQAMFPRTSSAIQAFLPELKDTIEAYRDEEPSEPSDSYYKGRF
jgi:hypothetical protein